MAQVPTVGIVGMKTLRRDITRLTGDAGPLNKALSDAGKQAAQPVAAASLETLPRVSGTLAGTVRVSGTRSGASVRMGKAKVPYAGAVEFGGWPEGREYLADGRYLFPAAHALADTVGTTYSAATQKALDAFGWSNETDSAEAVHD